MKNIIGLGLLAGVFMLIATTLLSMGLHSIFPSLQVEMANQHVYRPMNSPLMTIFYLYPFILGIALAWVWERVKKEFKGKLFKRAVCFGLAYLLVVGLPGMFITYTSMQVSLLMISSWLLGGFVNGIVSGLTFAKWNK
jgi:membrane protease YdiL (CAAX protease family)